MLIIVLFMPLSSCCRNANSWTIEVVDAHGQAFGHAPPLISAGADDGLMALYVDHSMTRKIILSTQDANMAGWSKVATEIDDFSEAGGFNLTEVSTVHGCAIQGTLANGRLYDVSSDGSGLKANMVAESARWACSGTRDADGRTDLFFGRAKEFWHGWRDDGDTWSFEIIAEVPIGNSALDSARGPNGLHVVYSSIWKLFYAHMVDEKWEIKRLGNGGYPVMRLDGAHRPHIVVINGTRVDWWRQDAEGVWIVELVYRQSRSKEIKHLGMALDTAGSPVVVVTESNALPWSVETTLVQKRAGKWVEEVLPWAARTNVAFDGQQRLHAVFADEEGVKHAVR